MVRTILFRMQIITPHILHSTGMLTVDLLLCFSPSYTVNIVQIFVCMYNLDGNQDLTLIFGSRFG
jgi:hypothetical protein